MKWHLALWADDTLCYSLDTEHSLPQEKTISLHSSHTVSSFKLDSIRSNLWSSINKAPKRFCPCICRELPWPSLLEFLGTLPFELWRSRDDTQCCLPHVGQSPNKVHPHTYTRCCLPGTGLEEEHSARPRMPSLGLILNPHKSHLSSSLTHEQH